MVTGADLGEYFDTKNDGKVRVQVDLSFVLPLGCEYGDQIVNVHALALMLTHAKNKLGDEIASIKVGKVLSLRDGVISPQSLLSTHTFDTLHEHLIQS